MYGFEILHKCGKKCQKFWGLIPMLVGVTAEKLVGVPFCRGAEFIQKFHKSEIYHIGENFVWKMFSLGKLLSPSQCFVTFPRRKVVPQI